MLLKNVDQSNNIVKSKMY